MDLNITREKDKENVVWIYDQRYPYIKYGIRELIGIKDQPIWLVSSPAQDIIRLSDKKSAFITAYNELRSDIEYRLKQGILYQQTVDIYDFGWTL